MPMVAGEFNFSLVAYIVEHMWWKQLTFLIPVVEKCVSLAESKISTIPPSLSIIFQWPSYYCLTQSTFFQSMYISRTI